MVEKAERQAAGVLRTLIALVVLFLFWGAVVYTFWPEWMPHLLGVVQSVRGIGAESFESTYFDVRNSSGASAAQVREAVRLLETDYQAILEFLQLAPGDPISVLITDGYGPALAEGYRLNLFYGNGVLDLDTAPFFLAFLSQGRPFDLKVDLFVEAGFALYVCEEIGRAEPLIGQPADAWVSLLLAHDALLPLAEARQLDVPQNEQDLFDAVRALVESGSFVRWLIEKQGMGVVQELRAGLSVETVTDQSLAEAEEAWLASVMEKELEPQPCSRALTPGSLLGDFCKQLEKEH